MEIRHMTSWRKPKCICLFPDVLWNDNSVYKIRKALSQRGFTFAGCGIVLNHPWDVQTCSDAFAFAGITLHAEINVQVACGRFPGDAHFADTRVAAKRRRANGIAVRCGMGRAVELMLLLQSYLNTSSRSRVFDHWFCNLLNINDLRNLNFCVFC